jgi:hypothetical protein
MVWSNAQAGRKTPESVPRVQGSCTENPVGCKEAVAVNPGVGKDEMGSQVDGREAREKGERVQGCMQGGNATAVMSAAQQECYITPPPSVGRVLTSGEHIKETAGAESKVQGEAVPDGRRRERQI